MPVVPAAGTPSRLGARAEDASSAARPTASTHVLRRAPIIVAGEPISAILALRRPCDAEARRAMQALGDQRRDFELVETAMERQTRERHEATCEICRAERAALQRRVRRHALLAAAH